MVQASLNLCSCETYYESLRFMICKSIPPSHHRDIGACLYL
ncbi:hypothetical protein QSI_1185 [Clostridioides difficile P28]|nr:hypothetical protein QSI_1185 [Clostridioides difficile P28]